MIIGLTGQTGAGKTTASTILANMGFKIVDADKIARQVVATGRGCLADLVLAFSVEIINSEGGLDRKKLGQIVFGNKEKLRKLNEIIFPFILAEVKEQLTGYEGPKRPPVILDAPTLFESGADKFCDVIVSVIADKELRRSRIIARDHLSSEEADRRMRSQHDDKYYTSRSQYVIHNNDDPVALRLDVLHVLGQMGIRAKSEGGGQ